MDNQATFKLGLIVEKKRKLDELRTEARALLDSLDFHFYRFPFELDKISASDVRNLLTKLLETLEAYQRLASEVAALEG